LHERHLDWTRVDIAHLAAFITWLRQPASSVISLEGQQTSRTNATIDQILSAVQNFYDFHVRMNTLPELPLTRLILTTQRRYKPFLHGIARAKPIQTRLVKAKREQRRPKTLTGEQVQQLLDACDHHRDRLLLTLLFETGMRIGQALGLRHEDINIEDGEIRIVPRDDNANGARAKTREASTIPAFPSLMELYTEYLITELHALEVHVLPDHVFVNLWEGEIGRPMTYAAVMSLVRHLRKKTGVPFTPHMLRHTRATIWIRDDHLPLVTVARLLGHASIQTTSDTYLQLTPQDLKQAVREAREGKHEQ
jgi:integrase/recombinase XerD